MFTRFKIQDSKTLFTPYTCNECTQVRNMNKATLDNYIEMITIIHIYIF